MADVLIICVRENLSEAEAIGQMLDAAGFNIGEDAVNDASLRACGAAVIVWSRNSVYCSTFAEATARAIVSGKAVIARLYPELAPHNLGAPTIELSHWNGDSEAPELDPLLYAVDRMVTAAQAAALQPLFSDDDDAEEAPAPDLVSADRIDWLAAVPDRAPAYYAAATAFAQFGPLHSPALRFANVPAETMWRVAEPAPEPLPPQHVADLIPLPAANAAKAPTPKPRRAAHSMAAMAAVALAAIVGAGGVAASLHFNRASPAPQTRADAIAFAATLLEPGVDGLNMEAPPAEAAAGQAPRSAPPASAPQVRHSAPPLRFAAPQALETPPRITIADLTPAPRAATPRRVTRAPNSTPRATASWDLENPLADLPPGTQRS